MVQPSTNEIYHDEYVPTLTAIGNVDSVSLTSPVFYYKKFGDFVEVSGTINIDATAASDTATEIEISLPIISDITNQYNVNGMSSNFASTEIGVIFGEVTNNTAFIRYLSKTTVGQNHQIKFTYEVK